MGTLAEGLPAEQARVRELMHLYRSLPGGCGMLGAHFMELALRDADRAAASGDIAAMIRAYQDLKGFEE